MLRKKYEAVFIQILTCQLSSFFVQNFVQTTSTLCKQRRQLCSNNVNFARTTTTLYEQCSHFVRTTSTLQGQRQLCTNNVHTLYEQRQLCKDNNNFVRKTSKLVRTAPNPLWGNEKLSIDLSSLFVGYSNMSDYTGHGIASDITMLIIKISTFYLPTF